MQQTEVANPKGKTRRYATQVSGVKHVRVDREGEDVIKTLSNILAGYDGRDTISVSLLLRRALSVYRDHVGALLTIPGALAIEKAVVRQHSRLPNVSGDKSRLSKPANSAV